MNPRVGPSGPLSRDRIVIAAVALADESGLEAVTMRRVADRLDAGAMSLYRHVPDKDELIVAMVDRVTAEHPYPDASGLGWRECMHILARQDWSAFVAHPWMLTAGETVTPPFGRASLTAMDWALAALEELDLRPDVAARAIMTINNYVQGSARVLLGDRNGGEDGDLGTAWQHRLRDLDLTDLPHLRRLIEYPLTPSERDWFTEGLDVILDGVQARSSS